MKSQKTHMPQEDSEMSTTQKVAQKAARRKLSMLELANELNNVSKACKIGSVKNLSQIHFPSI